MSIRRIELVGLLDCILGLCGIGNSFGGNGTEEGEVNDGRSDVPKGRVISTSLTQLNSPPSAEVGNCFSSYLVLYLVCCIHYIFLLLLGCKRLTSNQRQDRG